MPNVKEIKKTMKKLGIPVETMSKITFPQPHGNQPEEVLALIDQMDKLLTYDQCLSVMEEQGCCKDEKITAPFVEFQHKYMYKTIDEKIKLFDEIKSGHKPSCHLNHNGTLSIFWDGWNREKNQCVCHVIKRLYKNKGGNINVSKTFCGCCAGHVRNTFQCALGVKLHLKDIVSSPISSNGKKQCEFLFEIIKSK
jgi:hypothetical protein